MSRDLAEIGRRTVRAPRHAAHQRQAPRIAEQRHPLLAGGHHDIRRRRFGRWRRCRAGDRPRRWRRRRDDDAIAAGAARHGAKAAARQQAIERLLYRQRAAQLRRPHGVQSALRTDDIDPSSARERDHRTVECHGRDGKGDAPLRRTGRCGGGQAQRTGGEKPAGTPSGSPLTAPPTPNPPRHAAKLPRSDRPDAECRDRLPP